MRVCYLDRTGYFNSRSRFWFLRRSRAGNASSNARNDSNGRAAKSIARGQGGAHHGHGAEVGGGGGFGEGVYGGFVPEPGACQQGDTRARRGGAHIRVRVVHSLGDARQKQRDKREDVAAKQAAPQ